MRIQSAVVLFVNIVFESAQNSEIKSISDRGLWRCVDADRLTVSHDVTL